jgi:ABC-2 type transport system permease protein
MKPAAPDPPISPQEERAHAPAEPSGDGRESGGSRRKDTSPSLPSRLERWPVNLSRGVPVSAVAELLAITSARQIRGRRLLGLCALFSLPVVFALLARRFDDPYDAADVERILVFGLIPQALLPLSALLFASGMVQDEIEEQTLTYLLIRPIPRWLIYLAKLAATWLVTSVVTSIFTSASLAVVYWGTDDFAPLALLGRAVGLCGLLSLSLLAYVAIFGALSLLIRRSLLLGVAYIVIFEGVAANIDFVFRHLTVMYYMRTLSVRWLEVPGRDWAINLATAPGVAECLVCLAAAAVVPAIIGALVFRTREFRVKTPEGS